MNRKFVLAGLGVLVLAAAVLMWMFRQPPVLPPSPPDLESVTSPTALTPTSLSQVGDDGDRENLKLALAESIRILSRGPVQRAAFRTGCGLGPERGSTA